MDENTLSLVITCVSAVTFLLSAWGAFWIWRGRRGGWHRLAAAYPTTSRKDSNARRWQSIRLMPARINYRGLITFRLTVDGLYAVPLWLVRIGHEPVLIPWDDIEIMAVDTAARDRLYDLKFAKVAGVSARVSVGVAQLIRRAADNSRYFVETPAVHTTAKPAAAALRQSVA